MHIYLKRAAIYVFAAWLLLGFTFLFPQPVPSPEGITVTANGLPLPFYAAGTSVFTGAIPAQVSVGFLLADLFFWFIIIAAAHFVYRRFLST